MKPQALQLQATLEGVSTLKDGGMSLRFHTQELSNDHKATLLSFAQSFGWLLFSEQEQDVDSLELEPARKDIGGKTPSQRLRNVLYISYQQSGRIDISFEQFYAQKMEQIINHIKGTNIY